MSTLDAVFSNTTETISLEGFPSFNLLLKAFPAFVADIEHDHKKSGLSKKALQEHIRLHFISYLVGRCLDGAEEQDARITCMAELLKSGEAVIIRSKTKGKVVDTIDLTM